jgi:two-component system chemotaxis response regulator CheY
MKALVVDDELTTGLFLQEILSGYGEVQRCMDGQKAVETYRQELERGHAYDLVCMDIMMPVMGGLEALKLIRREEESHGRFRPQATKVIITTAAQDDDTINQAFRELCDAYIVKPIDAGELMGIVECFFAVEVPGR